MSRTPSDSVLSAAQRFCLEYSTDIYSCWPLTCCWLPCRPVGPPALASPGGAEWGWNGSSFGLSGRVWPCQFARLSLRGWDPAPRLRGWFEKLGGSYWPWGEQIGVVGSGSPHCRQCAVATWIAGILFRELTVTWHGSPRDRSNMWKRKPSSQAKQNSFWHKWFCTRHRIGSTKYNT